MKHFKIKNTEEVNFNTEIKPTPTDSSATILGVVTDTNFNAVANATVKIFTKSNVPFLHYVTDELGVYQFNNIAPDTYFVTVVTPNNNITEFQEIKLNSNQTLKHNFCVDINLKLSTLVGYVFFNNTPTGNAKVFLNGSKNFFTVTDKYGQYEILNIPSGIYKLTTTYKNKMSNTIVLNITYPTCLNKFLYIT